MKLVCPVCKSEIPIDDVDFASACAFCCHCEKDFDCQRWTIQKQATSSRLPCKGRKLLL